MWKPVRKLFLSNYVYFDFAIEAFTGGTYLLTSTTKINCTARLSPSFQSS